jgi:hypothetical protein
MHMILFEGNDHLAAITVSQQYVLRVDLTDWEGNSTFAEYSHFVVGSATVNYTLLYLGAYSGTAGKPISEKYAVQNK